MWQNVAPIDVHDLPLGREREETNRAKEVAEKCVLPHAHETGRRRRAQPAPVEDAQRVEYGPTSVTGIIRKLPRSMTIFVQQAWWPAHCKMAKPRILRAPPRLEDGFLEGTTHVCP